MKPLSMRYVLEGSVPRNDGYFTVDRIVEWTGGPAYIVEQLLRKAYMEGWIEYASGLQDARITPLGRIELQKFRKRA